MIFITKTKKTFNKKSKIKQWILNHLNLRIDGSIDFPATSKASYYFTSWIILYLPILFLSVCTNFLISLLITIILILIEYFFSKTIGIPKTKINADGLFIIGKSSKKSVFIKWNEIIKVNIRRELKITSDSCGGQSYYYRYFLRIYYFPGENIQLRLSNYKDGTLEIMRDFIRFMSSKDLNENVIEEKSIEKDEILYCSFCGIKREHNALFCQLCGNKHQKK